MASPSEDFGTSLASGDNYAFYQAGEVLICRVWRRSDLSTARGAASAAEIQAHCEEYSSGLLACPMLLDLTEGPAVMGPVTEASIGQLLAGFEKRRQPLAVLCSAEPMQRMQYQRMVQSHAPSVGRVHTDRSAAMDSLRGPPSGSDRPGPK